MIHQHKTISHHIDDIEYSMWYSILNSVNKLILLSVWGLMHNWINNITDSIQECIETSYSGEL